MYSITKILWYMQAYVHTNVHTQSIKCFVFSERLFWMKLKFQLVLTDFPLADAAHTMLLSFFFCGNATSEVFVCLTEAYTAS